MFPGEVILIISVFIIGLITALFFVLSPILIQNDKDCIVEWSDCTEQCDRSYTIKRERVGKGMKCDLTPKPCEDGEDECPPDIDCVGSWSACTDQCERTYTITTEKSGKGADCDMTPIPCEDGEDECPPDIDCVGKWSDCTVQCESGDERTYSVITPQSGNGESCSIIRRDCADEVGCEKPQNCTGTWSKCTAACEKASERTFTTITEQKGVGADCPGTIDCEPGMGECPPNINCEGSWSACDENGNRTFQITQPQSGQGNPCPTVQPVCDACTGYIEECTDQCENRRQRRFVITNGGYKNISLGVGPSTKSILRDSTGRVVPYDGPGNFAVDLTNMSTEWDGVDCPASLAEAQDLLGYVVNDCGNGQGKCVILDYVENQKPSNKIATGQSCSVGSPNCLNNGYKRVSSGFVRCPEGSMSPYDAVNLFSQEQLAQIGVNNAWVISVIPGLIKTKSTGQRYVVNEGGEDIPLPYYVNWKYNYCGQTVPATATQNLKDAMAAMGYGVGEKIECSSVKNICKTRCDNLGSECSGYSINTKNGNCIYQVNNAPACLMMDTVKPDDQPADVCKHTEAVAQSPLYPCGNVGYGWNYYKKT